MQRIFTIAIFIFTACSFALGQIKSDGITAQDKPVEQTLMSIEQEMGNALTEGDVSLFDKYLAENFVFSSPFGKPLSKAQVIEDVRSDSLKMESSKREDFKVQVNGETAIITYRSVDIGSFKFVDISGQYQWVDVFEKRAGQWQLIYEQGTAIKQRPQQNN